MYHDSLFNVLIYQGNNTVAMVVGLRGLAELALTGAIRLNRQEGQITLKVVLEPWSDPDPRRFIYKMSNGKLYTKT